MEPSRPPTREAEAPSPIKVPIVDDHEVVRRGLRVFFEFLDDIEVVRGAEDGRRAVRLTGDLAPDEVLVDLRVARGRSSNETRSGLDITERTARTNVSSILGNLDLASRTQAALWAIEHRAV